MAPRDAISIRRNSPVRCSVRARDNSTGDHSEDHPSEHPHAIVTNPDYLPSYANARTRSALFADVDVVTV